MTKASTQSQSAAISSKHPQT
jgi:polar amino acid transport system substrate-binding protein